MFNERRMAIQMKGIVFDKETEKEFYNKQIDSIKAYIYPLFIVFSFFYFIVGISDSIALGDNNLSMKIVFIRGSIFLLTIILMVVLSRLKKYDILQIMLTIYGVLFCISYLYGAYLFQFLDYYIQCFEVLMILTGIFLIPIDWEKSFVISIIFLLSFFLLAFTMIEHLQSNYFFITVEYVFIIFLLISILTYRISNFEREKYINENTISQKTVMDQLLEINDKAKFNVEFRKVFNYYKTHEGNLYVVLFGINEFDNIVEKYGKNIADKVLLEITKLVKKFTRENDIFARWGKDEFILLLSGMEVEIAMKIASRLKGGIVDYYFSEVGEVSCCFGLASPKEEESIQEFFERVERYLYKARRDGKNEVMFR
jgi:diguanylate cyclase (GGDEF)-like protein